MGFPAYFLGDDENGPVGAFWLNTLAMGSPAQALRLRMQPCGFSFCNTKVNRGWRADCGAGRDLPSYELPASSGPKVSKGRAESPLVRPQAHTPCPRVGNDAPTTAREQGLQPYGAFTLFFRWRKKSVQKKASGTATPGKSPLLPIFERGSSQCRAQTS